MDLLRTIALVHRQHRLFRAERAALARLSDRELAARGVARDGITRLAYEAAERRVTAEAQASRRGGPAGVRRISVLAPAS